MHIDEVVINAFRVMEITGQNLFSSLDSTEAGLKQSCKEAFGNDEAADGFFDKRDFAKIHKAWSRSRIDAEVEMEVDAV